MRARDDQAVGYMLGAMLLCAMFGPLACAALQSVTPADRAAAYAREAQGVDALCAAYRFDRAAGLVEDVPRMSALCP